MLTPEYLQSLPDDAVALWEQFETDILVDIAKRIKTGAYLTSAEAWRLNKLKDLGAQQSYLNQRLAVLSKKSTREINRIMGDALKLGLRDDMDRIRKAKGDDSIVYDPSKLNPIAKNGMKATNGVVKNYTKTYAAALSKTYENAIDVAFLNIHFGVMAPDQAVEYAVSSLFNQDVPVLRTANGRIERPRTVIARAVRTGTNQAMSKIQIANLEDLGCDLVETSSHYGARPSHAVWQGRVFSLSGKHDKYPDFRKSTGYGTGEGLCGWNCRHSFYPYFEGLSTKSFTHYDEEKNRVIYEHQQKLRSLQTRLSDLKKEQKVLSAGGVATGKVDRQIAKVYRYVAGTADTIEALKHTDADISSLEVITQIDTSVTKLLSSVFHGYQPAPLEQSTDSHFAPVFEQINDLYFRWRPHISINPEGFITTPPRNVEVSNVSLAIAFHERTHDLCAQIALRNAGVKVKSDFTVLNLAQKRLYEQNMQKLAEGVYIACFDKESYTEIIDAIRQKISPRAGDSGLEFLAEGLTGYMGLADPCDLEIKVYNYLKEQWAKSGGR